MKPLVKNVVGILSHVPIIYMVFFVVFTIFMITHPPKNEAGGMLIWFVIIFICHIFVILLMFVLIAFFIIWLIKGATLPIEAKIIWALGSFMMGLIIMPLLYWLYIRKAPDGPYVFGGPVS